MKPLVSIIMSTFNETTQQLSMAIESILEQTYDNFEFLIILDNPTNIEMSHLVNKYARKDSRIKMIKNQENMGLPRSLNKGIKEARGKYIARMDADDISMINRIEIQVSYMEKYNSVDILGVNRIDIDENNNEYDQNYKVITNHDKIRKILPYGSILTHPTVFMKTSIIKEVQGYREFDSAQDYDLWLRLLSKGYNFAILPNKLLKYRVHDKSISNSNPYKQFIFHRYAKLLYKQRNKYGEDNYSTANKKKYLEENKYYNEKVRINFKKSFHLFIESKRLLKEKKTLEGTYLLVKSIMTEHRLLLYIYDSVMFKFKLHRL